MRIEGMLDAGGGMQRIGSLIGRINQRARATIGRAGEASGIARVDANFRRLIYRRERRHPAVLREIVVEAAEAGAQDCFSVFTERIGNSQSRRERQPVIVRSAPILEEAEPAARAASAARGYPTGTGRKR